MLHDNSSPEKSVATWISEQTQSGRLDVTSGYFTVGILSWLSRELNEKISSFRFILGDIVSNDQDADRPINLLAETITVDAALRLTKLAREAVEFLKQDKVTCHTVEPNFCHAKTFLFRSRKKPDSYFVTGSSNLTEAGLGMQHTSNIELNVVGQGTAADYEEICNWFDDLWKREQTHAYKTVDGKRVHFKNYLIEQIEGVFREFTPKELYFKTLFELFKDQIAELEADPQFQQRIGHLKHSDIYQALYEFQKKGVLSLIKKMETYNGAILADAVGLGKTWSALAVIKYYELKGFETILLCPKKLSANWRRYLKRRGSIFDRDKLDYAIRYHTDLQDNRLETNHDDGLRLDGFFHSDRPKLFVIDESHNLRNRKSGRYQYLVEKLLKANREVKVLHLSATPINNDFKDLRNQFSLLVKDDDRGFADAPGILVNSLENSFRQASREFSQWSNEPDRNISTLLNRLPDEVIRLIDHLLVARTRKQILGLSTELDFPELRPPQNEYIESLGIDEFKNFDELLDALPPYFAAYKPAVYSERPSSSSEVVHDESLRDQFLVVMLHTLLVKRLESSWTAFHSTLKKIFHVHSDVLGSVLNYQLNKEDITISGSFDLEDEDESEIDMPIGRREIRLSEIEASGNLKYFEQHLQADVEALQSLIEKLETYAEQIEKEVKHQSTDNKLERLMKLTDAQLENSGSSGKILIFSSYADTTHYLFSELVKRGYQRVACIDGSGARLSDNPERTLKDFEPVLERFCPYTKLYRERDWPDFENKDATWEAYQRWKDWVAPRNEHVRDKLGKPVDIVIATDCLSEGQNLQDCDTVVNYDIHWNPVRVIQRLGRIDRIGSPNQYINGINFWPAPSMNDFLNLQRRVEDRAVAIATAGSEVPDISEQVRNRLQDEDFEQQQKDKLLEQMDATWEDIETGNQSLSFSDLSLEVFRQDLLKELQNEQERYQEMPLGVFTGFQTEIPAAKSGIVALLGYPSRKNGSKTPYKRHNLAYIGMDGSAILEKPGEVLKFLSDHHTNERSVPEVVERGEGAAINKRATAIKTWLNSFVAGDALDDLISGLQSGDLATQSQIEDGNTLEEQFDPENCDLILWFDISK